MLKSSLNPKCRKRVPKKALCNFKNPRESEIMGKLFKKRIVRILFKVRFEYTHNADRYNINSCSNLLTLGFLGTDKDTFAKFKDLLKHPRDHTLVWFH